MKKLIFALHLGIVWRMLGNFKFLAEKKKLQLKARLRSGNNQLKKELSVFFDGERKAYQSFTSSDLSDIPFFRTGDPRFKIIKENLSVARGTLLDIGANLGYFCHKFEDEGFDCYALEENRMLCYFTKELRKAEGKHFKVICSSIFDYKKNQELVFDVVFALSIFHHFLKSEDAYYNLIKLLKRLKAKELFFEPHLPQEFKEKTFYKNYTPDEFVDFIIENSCFRAAKLLGQSEGGGGRPIYKLTS